MRIDDIGTISEVDLYAIFRFDVFNAAKGCAVFASAGRNTRKVLRNELRVQINIRATLDINVCILYNRRSKIKFFRKGCVLIIPKQLISLGNRIYFLSQAVFRHRNRTFQLTRFPVRQIIIHRTRLYPFCIKSHAALHLIRLEIPLRRIIRRSVPTLAGIIVGIFHSANRRFFYQIAFFQLLCQRRICL